MLYPIFLDLSGRTAVIVGGGGVAVRKARGLLAGGCGLVRCVAPEIDPRMPSEVQRVLAMFDPRHLDGAHLVFAVTDSPAVNEAVVGEARARGLWVNRADSDDDRPGDFAVPAVWRSGALSVAVSAAGAPAIAAAVRDRIAETLDPGMVQLADAMQTLRPRIKAAALDSTERADILRLLAGAEALAQLKRGGPETLWTWLTERWPQLASGR